MGALTVEIGVLVLVLTVFGRPARASDGRGWRCRGSDEQLRLQLSAAPEAGPPEAVLAAATRRATGARACGALMEAASRANLRAAPQTAAVLAEQAQRRWPDQAQLGPLAIEAALRTGQRDRARTLLREAQRRDPRGLETRGLSLWMSLADGDLTSALRQADAMPADHPAAVCAYALAERAAEPSIAMAGRCDATPTPLRPTSGPRPAAAGKLGRAPAAREAGWAEAVGQAHALWRGGDRAAAVRAAQAAVARYPDDPALQLLLIRWGPAAEAEAALERLLGGRAPPPPARPTCPTDAALGAVMGQAAAELAQLRLKNGDSAGAAAALSEARRRFGPSPALAHQERRLREAPKVDHPP